MEIKREFIPVNTRTAKALAKVQVNHLGEFANVTHWRVKMGGYDGNNFNNIEYSFFAFSDYTPKERVARIAKIRNERMEMKEETKNENYNS